MEIEPSVNNTSGNYGKYLLQHKITGVVFFLQEHFFPILIQKVGMIVSFIFLSLSLACVSLLTVLWYFLSVSPVVSE